MLEIKSLEFEYLHRKLKVDAKCRLAEMKSVMTSLPLARVFQCLSTFALVSVPFVVIEGNWTAQLIGNHRGIGRGIQNYFQRRSCKLFLLSVVAWQCPSKPILINVAPAYVKEVITHIRSVLEPNNS